MLLSMLFFENVLLGAFNPLRFSAFIQQPTFQMAGFMAAKLLFDKLFDPPFTIALNLFYPGAGYQ